MATWLNPHAPGSEANAPWNDTYTARYESTTPDEELLDEAVFSQMDGNERGFAYCDALATLHYVIRRLEAGEPLDRVQQAREYAAAKEAAADAAKVWEAAVDRAIRETIEMEDAA